MDWKAEVEKHLNPVYLELLRYAEWCAKLPRVKDPTFEKNPVIVDRVELLRLLHIALEEINRLENDC